MPGIFISYRRKDSAGSTGRLHDRLCLEFGKEEIFIDVEDIPVGQQFVEYIKQQVRACGVVLVVIGPQWTTLPDASGRPRIHNPDDVVRLELVTALQARKPIIPVLVDGATMPQPNELPGELVPLTMINASELPARHWDKAVAELVEALRRLLPAAAQTNRQAQSSIRQAAAGQPRPPRRFGWTRLLVTGAVLAVVAVVGASLLAPDDPADPALTVPAVSSADPVNDADNGDPDPADSGNEVPSVQDVEHGLEQVNIALSTGTEQDTARVRGYLADPAGAYYLLALNCLEILADRQLVQTGYLDMIDKWYTVAVGGEDQYLTSDGTLDTEVLKQAMVMAHNEYYGETAASLDDILAP